MKARVQRGRGKLKDVLLDCCNVELDHRGGLLDYERRAQSKCDNCDCE
jgi:RNA polymerase sigma-70 factor (ECF subfamily)